MKSGDVIKAYKFVGEEASGSLETVAIGDLVLRGTGDNKKTFAVSEYSCHPSNKNLKFLELLRCDVIPGSEGLIKVITKEKYRTTSDQAKDSNALFESYFNFLEGSKEFKTYQEKLQKLELMNRKKITGDPWVI